MTQWLLLSISEYITHGIVSIAHWVLFNGPRWLHCYVSETVCNSMINHIKLTLTLLIKLSSAWFVVCFTLKFYQFIQNLEDILAEWQTVWNLTRRRVTRCLILFHAVCKGLTIIFSRLKVKLYFLIKNQL